MPSSLYIGLISGTSMDAIDCALVDFSDGPAQQVDFINTEIPDTLRRKLLNLCQDQYGQIRLLGETDVEFARLLADAVQQILALNSLKPDEIAAIGSHGQTVRHQPRTGESSNVPFTLQIGDPNTLAEITGITTVADFRRRDMAAGGQGAPIVPAFHREIFSSHEHNRIVLNIGGISNITVLPRNRTEIIGFDTGPGNVLMDYWIGQHQGQPFDRNGEWAARGTVDADLLSRLLTDAYFSLPAPKSTGRELFNPDWLQTALDQTKPDPATADVQATLLALTVTSIGDAIRQHLPDGEIIVCGGGANNRFLMETLAVELPGFTVLPSSALGVMEDSVEAVAFAWLARETLAGRPVDFTGITGSRHPVIAGGVYYAG